MYALRNAYDVDVVVVPAQVVPAHDTYDAWKHAPYVVWVVVVGAIRGFVVGGGVGGKLTSYCDVLHVPVLLGAIR